MNWQLRVRVGSQSISPLYWALRRRGLPHGPKRPQRHKDTGYKENIYGTSSMAQYTKTRILEARISGIPLHLGPGLWGPCCLKGPKLSIKFGGPLPSSIMTLLRCMDHKPCEAHLVVKVRRGASSVLRGLLIWALGLQGLCLRVARGRVGVLE